MAKLLDENGLAYFWGKVKAAIPTKTSQLTNDSSYITADSPALTGVPTAPTAAVGTDSTQIATTAFVKATVSAAAYPLSIEITTAPTKTEYKDGEAISISGMVVKATYSNGTVEDITSACTYSPTTASMAVDAITVTWKWKGIKTYTATQAITVKASIYGVYWDGTSTTKFSRTDSAANFADPVPYVAGATSYGSPFDNIAPWSEMTIVDDATAGKLVKIPKYYYKWAKTGTAMKLQVSSESFDGALVSPAHADRGDGTGERDVVYVGRYHCNSSYKSVTGSSPKVSITRATARSSISSLGSAYWQYDYAMYWTIAMLYLVEFGDWNSQAKIGYGCGNGSGPQSVGASDSMPYHTGTMQSSRTTYGVGTQYRYIEDLWGNVLDWCDGIYFSGSKVYAIKNPSSFSDSSGGTNIATRPTSSSYISAWSIPTASGFEYALYPSAVAGSDSTYIPDCCYYSSSGVVLCVGGSYGQDLYRGLFCLAGGGSASGAGSSIGCRLQKLP